MGISVRIKLGRCDCGWACGGKCMKGDLGLTTCGAWRGAPKTKTKTLRVHRYR